MKVKIKSYAKINLALNVIGKTSLLHKIESIVAFVSLYDEISIKSVESNNHKISFFGDFSNGITKNNTLSKLIKVLEKKKLLKILKFQIKVKKNIPSKAGLGGGSMNAASVLNYFVNKKIIKVNKKELIKICKLIGSDVILGLYSTNTILYSNNQIKRFKNSKKIYALIVKPNFGCSTSQIYSKIRNYNNICTN